MFHKKNRKPQGNPFRTARQNGSHLVNPTMLEFITATILATPRHKVQTCHDFMNLLDYMQGTNDPQLRVVQDALVDMMMEEKTITLDTMRRALAMAQPWYNPVKNRALLGVLKG